MKKIVFLLLVFSSNFCFAQESFKNEFGVSLVSSHLLGDVYNMRNHGGRNLYPLNAITYKRQLTNNFSARGLVGFESGAFSFPGYGDVCNDCGSRFFSLTAMYTQAGVQFSKRIKSIEPFLYTDVRYYRAKEYNNYTNYAWGEQVGESQKTIDAIGLALGAGVQYHISNRFSLRYEPSFILQTKYTNGEGVHNRMKQIWDNEKENESTFRPVNVMSINFRF